MNRTLDEYNFTQHSLFPDFLETLEEGSFHLTDDELYELFLEWLEN